MNDWVKVSDEDAEKIKAGGSWAYQGGTLVEISMEAITQQLRDEVPGRLAKLADQLGIDPMDAMAGLVMRVTDDITAVTMTVHANGGVATDTWPIAARAH